MATAVRISDDLANDARKYSKIDHWAIIGKCAEENPDLTYDLIKEILIGNEELERGEKSEYQFG